MENSPDAHKIRNKLLTHGELCLSYRTYGHGSQPLLAFHGFGRSGTDFQLFEAAIGHVFTIYAFDIFHHGESCYPESRIEKNTLRKTEIKVLFDVFLKAINADFFSVMGFSLGGKIALTLLEQFPDRVSHLILMAPDGVFINRWYKFAAKTRLGKGVYKWVDRNPVVFFRFLDFLRWSHIIHRRLHRWVRMNMETAEKRERVYKLWMTFRNIDPDIPAIRTTLNKREIPAVLIFGRYDRVIPPAIGERFSRGLSESVQFKVLEHGHMLMLEDVAAVVGNWLRRQKPAKM